MSDTDLFNKKETGRLLPNYTCWEGQVKLNTGLYALQQSSMKDVKL